MTTKQAAIAGDEPLSQAPVDDWPFRVLRRAHELEERLADPAWRDAISDQLVEVATEFECRTVTGASQVGDQLAGVIAARSRGAITLWGHNGTQGNVLVVEGVLATGTQLIVAASRAREHGAKRIIGAAVMADPQALAHAQAAIEDAVVTVYEV